jgi:hypothetical protein
MLRIRIQISLTDLDPDSVMILDRYLSFTKNLFLTIFVKPFILKIKLNIRYNFLNWFICAYGSGSGPKKDRIRNTDRTVGAAAGLRLPRGSRHPHLECCQEGDHQLEECCSHFHNLSEMCHIVPLCVLHNGTVCVNMDNLIGVRYLITLFNS